MPTFVRIGNLTKFAAFIEKQTIAQYANDFYRSGATKISLVWLFVALRWFFLIFAIRVGRFGSLARAIFIGCAPRELIRIFLNVPRISTHKKKRIITNWMRV